MAARRGLALDAPMHPTNRAYCDFLLALTYAAYPAQITAICALERTYLEGWEGARPGAQPYREFVERWTTDEFRSYVGDLQAAVDRQLEASVGDQARAAEDAFVWVTPPCRRRWLHPASKPGQPDDRWMVINRARPSSRAASKPRSTDRLPVTVLSCC
jgi:hypothetical protein